MEDRVRVALLMDVYGSLLSDRQQQAMQLYYQMDWSLSEIGTEMGISRQGVMDALHRGTETLCKLEACLCIRREWAALEALLTDPSLSDGEARRQIAGWLAHWQGEEEADGL